jgi:hypothetical protein
VLEVGDFPVEAESVVIEDEGVRADPIVIELPRAIDEAPTNHVAQEVGPIGVSGFLAQLLELLQQRLFD